MAIIEFERVSFTYRGLKRPAIKDVDLRIEKGEYVVITGPTGCGKSTLLRCINGLIPHFYEGDFKGNVYVDGLNTREHQVFELATRAGLVFQDPESQIFCLTVESELAFGPENLGLPPDEIGRRIAESAELTEVSGILDRLTYELSGGEKQRVAIAAVLALKPSILVLDEPTSNIDPKGTLRILEVVRRLNQVYGTTVVIVEHKLELVSLHADRMVLMKEGEIVEDGSPRKVLTSETALNMGIGIPKVVQLYLRLKKEHRLSDKVPLSPREMKEVVLSLRGRGEK